MACEAAWEVTGGEPTEEEAAAGPGCDVAGWAEDSTCKILVFLLVDRVDNINMSWDTNQCRQQNQHPQRRPERSQALWLDVVLVPLVLSLDMHEMHRSSFRNMDLGRQGFYLSLAQFYLRLWVSFLPNSKGLQ